MLGPADILALEIFAYLEAQPTRSAPRATIDSVFAAYIADVPNALAILAAGSIASANAAGDIVLTQPAGTFVPDTGNASLDAILVDIDNKLKAGSADNLPGFLAALRALGASQSVVDGDGKFDSALARLYAIHFKQDAYRSEVFRRVRTAAAVSAAL